MRTRLLAPLALAATAVVGCRTGSDGTEQAAFQVPQRDLTLQQAETPQVAVASPVELGRAPVQQPRTERPRRIRRPAPAVRPAAIKHGSAPTAPTSVPAETSTAPTTVASAEATEAPDPYALPPGKTVTVIPASSGPSPDPGWTDRGPPDARPGTAIYGGSGGSGGSGGCAGSGGCGDGCDGHHPGRGLPGGFRGSFR
jgi:hypothetical protein